MTYPSLPMAGFTAWAVGAHFAMASVRIDSRRGLGVNEQFMALAPTGYGKEEIRAPFEILARELQETARPTGVPSAWQIGRAHVRTTVTNAQHVCRLLLENKKHVNNLNWTDEKV